jgi:hypothetical protein
MYPPPPLSAEQVNGRRTIPLSAELAGTLMKCYLVFTFIAFPLFADGVPHKIHLGFWRSKCRCCCVSRRTVLRRGRQADHALDARDLARDLAISLLYIDANRSTYIYI